MNSNLPIDLEWKAEAAIISRLGECQELSGVTFRQQASEEPKTNGIIVVSAKRGAEVIPVSGIFKIDVEVDITLRIRRPGNSLATFARMSYAISQVFETHPALLAEQLTLQRTDWRCYICEISTVDKKPTDKAHHCTWSLQMEAMDVSSQLAEKLHHVETINL